MFFWGWKERRDRLPLIVKGARQVGKTACIREFAEGRYASVIEIKKDNSTLEIDFLMRSGDDLVPVEVKAENSRAKSLRTLIDSDNYRDIRWGVKLVHGDVGFEGRVLTVPQWGAFMLRRLLKDSLFVQNLKRL